MIPLALLMRKEKMGFRFGDKGRKVNHLFFMDDLKVNGGSFEEVEKLCDVVHKFSKDIGMEFRMDKCTSLQMIHKKKVGMGRRSWN